MFLGRLFRYRTRERLTPLENFLSTVLAELLLDRGVLDALGKSLEVSIPAGFPQVRTQVRAASDEAGVADLVIDLPKWHLVIECKAGMRPNAEQIQRYRRLFPRAIVALVAPRRDLPAADAEAWKGVPRTSWEDLAARLLTTPPSDPWVKRLATEFVNLLRYHSYGPLLPVSVTDVATYAKAIRKIEKRRHRKVRDAVEMLLPRSQQSSVGVDDFWGSSPPLEAWWERGRGDASLPLTGLGLQGLVEPDGSLRWNLWLSPASKGPTAAGLRAEGFVEQRDGWWLHLTEGEAESTLEDELAEAVELARSSLRRLKLPAGRATPSWRRVTPVAHLTQAWGGVRETGSRLGEWRGELARAVTRELKASLHPIDVWQGRIYTTVAAPARRAWVWTEHDDPTRLEVHWGWGNPKRNLAMHELARAWWQSAPQAQVELSKHKDHAVTVLSADLGRQPVGEAVAALATATARAFVEVPKLLL